MRSQLLLEFREREGLFETFCPHGKVGVPGIYPLTGEGRRGLTKSPRNSIPRRQSGARGVQGSAGIGAGLQREHTPGSSIT